ncbi:MAG: WD40 repeat domain-containing protein [Pseudomonadota bacterium]
MSTDKPPIEVLRPEPCQSVTRLLEAVVRSRPDLRQICSALVRPLRLLRELGAATDGTLGEEPWTAERFRLLLGSTGGAGIPLREAAQELGIKLASETPAPPLGLLHLGKLAAVSFAAIRCGLPLGTEDAFLETLLGLSLSLGPCDAILRLGTAPEAIEALVLAFADALASRQKDERAVLTLLRVLRADPVERQRQRALIALFSDLAAEVERLRGGAAVEGEYRGWRESEPTWVGMDPALFIQSGKPSAPRPGAELWLEVPASARDRERLRLLFVNPDRPAEGAWVELAPPPAADDGADAETVELGVVVPQGAEPGWRGLIAQERIPAINLLRSKLHGFWSSPGPRYLESTPFTPALLPLLREEPEAGLPPVPGSQPFDGGLPTLVEAAVHTAATGEDGGLLAAPGEEVQIAWTSRAADGVLIHLGGHSSREGASGSKAFPAPAAEGETWTLSLTPYAVLEGDERLLGRSIAYSVRVPEPPPREEPDPLEPLKADLVALSKSLAALVAAKQSAALLAQLSPAATGTALPLSWSLGGTSFAQGGLIPLPPPASEVVGPGSRVVLIEPAFVQEAPLGIGAEGAGSPSPDVASELTRFMKEFLLSPTFIRLPWVADELAVTFEQVEGNDDPATLSFLDALAAQAARTPGLEDALWIAVVPGNGVAVITLSEAARVLAVVSPDRIRDTSALLVAALQEFPLATRVPRIRINGRLHAQDRLLLDPLRIETRAAGGGAMLTGLEAVALDRAGRELSRRALTAVRPTLPATVTALLPVPAGVRAVEIRLGSRVLQRVDAGAPPASLGISGPILQDDVVTWTCAPQACARHVWLELGVPSPVGDSEISWVPFGAFAAAGRQGAFVRASALGWRTARLVASDGWYHEELLFIAGSPLTHALAVRALEGGRLAAIWTETADSAPIAVEASWTAELGSGWSPLAGGGLPDGPAWLISLPLGWAGRVEATWGGVSSARAVGYPPAVLPLGAPLPIVVIRPTALREGDPPTGARVDPVGAAGLLATACARGGLVPAMVELPWVPDPLAVVPAADTHADAGGERQLLAAATFSALSLGLEDLPWIVLMPDLVGERWASEEPTPGALRVLVGTCAGVDAALDDVIRAWNTREPGTPVSGMVLAGRLDAHDMIALDHAYGARRVPGPGEEEDLRLDVVSLDAADAVLASHALFGIRTGAISPFDAFVPLPPAAAALELRRDQDTLLRMVSPAGPPTVDASPVEDHAVTVQVSHPDHVPCKIWLEARVAFPPELAARPPAWVRCGCLTGQAKDAAPTGPLALRDGRLEVHDGLRLAVSDDWNVTTAVPAADPSTGPAEGDPAPDPSCAIRPVADGQWVLVRGQQIAEDIFWVFHEQDGTRTERQETVMEASGSGTLEAHEGSFVGPLLDLRAVVDGGPDPLPCGGVAEQVALVLLRPVVIGREPPLRVELEQVERALDLAERATGLRARLEPELAWVEDPLAVVQTTPWGERDPQVPLILERLAVRAARTIGADNALWLMVVPGETPWSVARRAHGAAALAISTVAAIPDLMRRLARLLRAQVTRSVDEPHVRFIGWVDDQATLHVKDLRCEQRRRATDLPEPSGVSMALLTTEANTVVEVPVAAGREAVPTWLTALVPTAVDVTRMTLYQEGRVIGIGLQVLGAPSFAQDPTLDDAGMLRWRYRHTSAIEPHLSLRAGTETLRTPVGVIPACRGAQPAGLRRFGHAAVLELTACDGWNEAHARVAPPPWYAAERERAEGDREPRAAIRTDARGHWWCDLRRELDDERPTVTWDLSEVRGHGQAAAAVRGRRLALPAAAEGSLQVHVWEDSDVPLRTRAFGTGEPAPAAPVVPQWVRTMALSADRGHIAIATVDDRVLWGPVDGAFGAPRAFTDSVRALALPQGGASVYVGLGSGEVRHVGTSSLKIGRHGAAVRCLALERHGGWLVSAGEDGVVWAWSLDGRAPLLVDQRTAEATAVAVKLTQQVPPDGSAARPVLLVVTGWSDGVVRVRALDFHVDDPMAQQAPLLVGCHPGAIRTVDIGRGDDGLLPDPRNLRLLSACEEGEVHVWWLQSQALCSGGEVLSWHSLGLAVPADHTGTVRFEGDAGRLVTQSEGAREGRWQTGVELGSRLLRWRAPRARAPSHLPALGGTGDTVTAWTNHPHTSETLAGTARGRVLLVDHEGSRELGQHPVAVRTVAIDPGGGWATTADEDGLVLLWKLQGLPGRPLTVTHQAAVGAALGLLQVEGVVVVVSGGSDGKLRVWAFHPEAPTTSAWSLPEEVGYHATPVTGVDVALVPDEAAPTEDPAPALAWVARLRVASSARGEPERIWRPVDGDPTRPWESAPLDCPGIAAASARFNQEGTRIAYANAWGRVASWLIGYDGRGVEASLVDQWDYGWPALDARFLDRSHHLLAVLGTRGDAREIGEVEPDALD